LTVHFQSGIVAPMNAKKPLWIPDDLHSDLKVAAIRRGVNLQELSVSILRAGITSEQKLKKRKSP
jgi:hypothetical protein